MKTAKIAPAAIVIAMIFVAGRLFAITGGQTDDFEDGTLQSWANGGVGAPPVQNISTGGPAGANDNFLQVTADGSGAGTFLTVFNRSQWIGDYIGAGVISVSMDLQNLGATNLSIHLAFKTVSTGGSSGYVTEGFDLTAGSGWQHAVFLIDRDDMVAVGTPADFATFFGGAFVETRIINEVGTLSLNGDGVVGQLGVDNIHANIAAVPESGTWVAGSLTCVLFLARRWKRR